MQNPMFGMKKQLTRSKIDSNSKLLIFVSVRVFSIHPYLHAKFPILLAKCCIPSILIDPECSMGFFTIERYQNIWILVTKLFTIYLQGPSQGLMLLAG